jgi:hypothetical protein
MIRAICTWLGTLASVLGFAHALWPIQANLSLYQAGWLAVVSLVFLVAMFADLREHWRRRPRRYKTPYRINNYMYRWIRHGGRVVVFTRDMSWADETRMENLLVDKARRDELTICLPNHIELTRRLAGAGAKVFTYGDIDHIPASRFTIINDGRMDASVAIGRQIHGTHVIEEYANGEHPVFAVAQDLTAIIRKLSQ